MTPLACGPIPTVYRPIHNPAAAAVAAELVALAGIAHKTESVPRIILYNFFFVFFYIHIYFEPWL